MKVSLADAFDSVRAKDFWFGYSAFSILFVFVDIVLLEELLGENFSSLPAFYLSTKEMGANLKLVKQLAFSGRRLYYEQCFILHSNLVY